jgi:hypothetical protein
MYSCILYSRCIAVYDCIAIQWARPHACLVYSCIIHTFLYNSCRKRCIRLTAFLGPRPEIQARATTAQLAAASWSLLREEAKQSALDQPRRDLRLTSPCQRQAGHVKPRLGKSAAHWQSIALCDSGMLSLCRTHRHGACGTGEACRCHRGQCFASGTWRVRHRGSMPLSQRAMLCQCAADVPSRGLTWPACLWQGDVG